MVDRIPAFILLVPLEQREFCDPEKLEGVGVCETLLLRNRNPKLAEQHRRTLRWSGGQQQEVVLTGTCEVERRTKDSFAQCLHRTEWRLARPHPDESRKPNLLGLINEDVKLTA